MNYKQELVVLFNNRSGEYDRASSFHPKLAHKLVEMAGFKLKEEILDLATGTGLVGIEAAKIVGNQGKVVGIDLSEGMLYEAKQKIYQLGLTNIELIQQDVESLELGEAIFDWVVCCSALTYLSDIPLALKNWQKLLKVGGKIALTGFSDTSFIFGVVLRKVALKYGVELANWNELTGNIYKCYDLLESAGYVDNLVIQEDWGYYMSLEEAQKIWDNNLSNPLSSKMLELGPTELELAQADFKAELVKLLTPYGIWNEITIFFMFGNTPIN